MKVLLAVLIVVVGLGFYWCVTEGPLRDPEDALSDFIEGKRRAEDQLTDPLVLAGPNVRPLVLKSVKDPGAPQRRYAIGYLGCTGYEPAASVLRKIVATETEEIYFRADALDSLWLLQPVEGVKLALAYQNRDDFLGATAQRIVAGKPVIYCRSWVDAFLGRHG